jgi:hypothetical protein
MDRIATACAMLDRAGDVPAVLDATVDADGSVTGRATFGDFATAATRHLARAVSLTDPGTTGRAASVRAALANDVRRGMSRAVAVMGRYLADITTSYLQGVSRRASTCSAMLRSSGDLRGLNQRLMTR